MILKDRLIKDLIVLTFATASKARVESGMDFST